MTPEERDLIAGLFTRLRAADAAGKDREAEAFIASAVTALPSAPYLLTQAVLVQEHALTNAQARIAELERALASARERAEAASPPPSFLGGLLGGGQRAARPAAAASGPWGDRGSVDGYGPQGQAYQRPMAPPPQSWAAPPTYAAAPSGGGFLSQALTTAAGVAGGALLFEGISSLLRHDPGPFGGYSGYSGYSAPTGPTTEIINNYYGDAAPSGTYQDQPVADPGAVEVAADDGTAFDDGADAGFDGGSGDDWA